MAFPGPLAFRPPRVMMPAPDAPNALVPPPALARLSAVVDALERKDFVQVQALVRASCIEGADVAPMPEEPPLPYAARLGYLGLVEALLAAGVQVNLANPTNGNTLLIIAADNGYVGIVNRLLAQPGIECNNLDDDGDSALTCAAMNNHPEVVDCLLAAAAQVNLADILRNAVLKNHAGLVEVLLGDGAQRSDLPADLSDRSASFVMAIEDLKAGQNSAAPALPGPEQSKGIFEELVDKLASREPGDEPMLQWLEGKGLRRACAVELLAVLAGAQAPWKIHDASRQQKMLSCLGAISRLPALGAAGKVLKLYEYAGISAAAVERLGGAASGQMNHMASLAAGMLADVGGEMLNALVDGCMAWTNTDGEVNVAEFTASLITQGYCHPVAQVIVRSWQEAISAWGELPMPPFANGTTRELMAVLKDHMAKLAPALFAQALLRNLASHEPVRQLSAMQGDGHDEMVHALFQVQCDQVRQFCEQLLAPPSSSMTGTSQGAATAH